MYNIGIGGVCKLLRATGVVHVYQILALSAPRYYMSDSASG